ncbi:MAG: hypothetical protein CO113_15920 [Elusimicrobia bacterium CG_4_9_14_3_um_filter_62_55]|nr:MAG: hypothetical protein COR54_05550 [Elusimicrobia bacterium CG22_combo_CG10-13_8_21_14_all_63_91]PJA18429.1 MAG: hypothetical protein COX66_01215 [Elusimicrobia bacterium CG_4_10_14_0_2_um_filter_63_34]PJB24069.1 MAG: hypothetical protein CO113_15920 [Elusimicrobia bacterium CG_4_9_14_3_um_filter_62_55]
MSFNRLCAYDFCEDKEIEGKGGNIFACSKCGAKKPMHKNCVDMHIQEKHNGKAYPKALPDLDLPGPIGFSTR